MAKAKRDTRLIKYPNLRIGLALWCFLVVAYSFLTPKYEITDAGFHIPAITCFNSESGSSFCKPVNGNMLEKNYLLDETVKPICEPRANPPTKKCILNQANESKLVDIDSNFLKFGLNLSSLNFTSQIYYGVMHIFTLTNFTTALFMMSLLNLLLLFLTLFYILHNLDQKNRYFFITYLIAVGTPITVGLTGSIHPSSWTITGLILYLFSMKIRLQNPEKKHTFFAILCGATLVLISLRWGILILIVATFAFWLLNSHESKSFFSSIAQKKIKTLTFIAVLFIALFISLRKFWNWKIAFSNGNTDPPLRQILNMNKNYWDLITSIFGHNIDSEMASYLASYRIAFPDLLINTYILISVVFFLYIMILQSKSKLQSLTLLAAKLALVLAIGLFIPLLYRHFYGNGASVQSHHIIPYYLIFVFSLLLNVKREINRYALYAFLGFSLLVLFLGVLYTIDYFSPSYPIEFSMLSTSIILCATIFFSTVSLALYWISKSKQGNH
jgi:hypothetical protein